jgi:hypothetical protein
MPTMDPSEMFAGFTFTMDACIGPNGVKLLNSNEEGELDDAIRALLHIVGFTSIVGGDTSDVAQAPENAGIRRTFVTIQGDVVFRALPLRSRFICDIFGYEKFDNKAANTFLRDRFFVQTASTHWIQRAWS